MRINDSQQMNMLPGRYFNRIVHDTERSLVTKTSSNDDKLADEIRWYLQLPAELSDTVPHLEKYSLQDEVHFSMEFIGSQTVGDCFVARNQPDIDWTDILYGLHRILDRFTHYPGTLSKQHLYNMYFRKTRQRISAVLSQHERIRALHQRGHYQLNGMTMLCPIRTFYHRTSDLIFLLNEPINAIIHGDLCFSNLFYLPQHSSSLKLIDPRGSFGSKGIYGDQRYDMAKVRHSLSGYEHIVRNRYRLGVDKYDIELKIDLQTVSKGLRNQWDRMLGSHLRAVKIIEALLFLSMLPLHKEDPQRQLAFYALSTELLADALSDRRGTS
ncbi:hypothetical protein [Cohnella soli]|uniref:Aminoglycoside phosphotransferase domain-containing protein n=1 Tax=Cohnella soli TaxID=425005 RepID=A0ABW0I1X8_9BACL